jgi:hypothetical protein
MNLSLRAPSLLAAIPTALLVGMVVGTPASEPAPPPAIPGDAALNHYVYDTTGVDPALVRQHAADTVAHLRQEHKDASFELFSKFMEGGDDELHILLETVNTVAQRVFLDEYGSDEVCRALIERERELFRSGRDVYMRLVSSAPEKERRLGPQGGLIIWSLEARFPRLGEALDTIEALTVHLNETYPGLYFRAYDEWFPRSGRLHIYIYGSGIAKWEAIEARIRHDPVYRELMAGAADAFVEGSFDDLWLAIMAR